MNKVATKEEALQKAAKQLDIAPSKYKLAMERFSSMKEYLLNGSHDNTSTVCEVYLQGSFNLGTEIRPYKNSKDADYDIDIVCRLAYQKDKVTPKSVKHEVGNLLKSHGTYSKLLDKEGKRCWTLNYAERDGIGFHMDILPSVQEHAYYSNDIAVTNKCSNPECYNWSSSNPKDFATWFHNKNKTVFNQLKEAQKQILFEGYRQEGIFDNYKDVPDFHVKTPLQRSIQLLKRHRDIRFSNQKNEKYKPISMVITALATQIYQNESTIYETLENFILTLSRHSEQMSSAFCFDKTKAESTYSLITRTADSKWYIPNPTNPEENFADKWHEVEDGVPHARAKAFFQWVEWIKNDFITATERLDEEHYTRILASPSNNRGIAISQPRGISFDVAHRQKPYWPLVLNHIVKLHAKYKINNLWREFRPGEPLAKQLELLFCASTDVPAPFLVYWQVVNNGKEAQEAKQLRGEILPSKIAGMGGLTQKENSLYSGVHWIECFIIKNGVCVARSGEFIVRIV